MINQFYKLSYLQTPFLQKYSVNYNITQKMAMHLKKI